MRAFAFTLAACLVALAGWWLGGVAAFVLRVEELTFPARVCGVFACLIAADLLVTRFAPASLLGRTGEQT